MAKKSKANSKKTPASSKPSSLIDTRVIFCGDNLDQLKKFPDGCVDLIYIDPPFNSNRNYEVFWGETKEKRSFEDRHASTQAYIDFMRPRCVELHRVLKKTGSFYYHCDWHASHYVKIMLDQIFSENLFQNEIIWCYKTRHFSKKHFSRKHDTIFFYTKSDNYVFNWNDVVRPLSENTIKKYKHEDKKGHYRLVGRGITGSPIRSAKDVDPKWEKTNPELVVRDYLEDKIGIPIEDYWGIDIINQASKERLGYPTQKPLPLLERIIKASSKPNDIVLDAFCGCGTALVAAENLGRQWIGIDISPTACRVMAKRLRDVCGMKEDEKLWRIGRGFVVRDLPWTEKQLKEIPPFEFENWAVIALGGVPNVAKVGDMGIDGRIYPVSAVPKKTKGELDFMDVWYPIQVKQKDKVGSPDIRDFEGMMVTHDRSKGFFVSFGYSQDAMSEIQAFFKKTGKSIIALTVKDILEEQIAYKLA
jgi:DNA modification methylase